MANIAHITLPAFTVDSEACVEVPEFLGLCIRLSNFAVSQYIKYRFKSMNEFQGKYLGAGTDGIFVLDTTEKDSGVDIDSIIELYKTDFGVANQKRFRSVYIGYETSGDLKLTLSNDDGNEREYQLAPIKTGQLQHGGKIPVNRDGKGRYWTFKIENVDGCDFSIDSIEVIPIVLGRKPSGL